MIINDYYDQWGAMSVPGLHDHDDLQNTQGLNAVLLIGIYYSPIPVSMFTKNVHKI